jgi:choline kinase
MHHLIEEEIGKIPQAANVRTEINPDFTNGSVVSLYCACERLEADVPVILMDADVLYHKDVIGRLIESEHQNVFLLDRDFEPGDEPVKLCIRDHRIVEFRKQVNKDLAFDFMGESVGFFRFSEKVFQALHDHTKRYLDGNKASEPYEEVIRDLVLDSPALFGYEDITGLPWLEIDFPDDVIKAERLVAEIDD